MEIFTGIDIVENKRIERAINKLGNKFLNRIYTERELDYCFSQKEKIPCLSARFACKEAVIKAFFQAFKKVLYFKNIEVLGKRGYPATILLHIDENPLKPYDISISIAHEKNYSVAVAILTLK